MATAGLPHYHALAIPLAAAIAIAVATYSDTALDLVLFQFH